MVPKSDSSHITIPTFGGSDSPKTTESKSSNNMTRSNNWNVEIKVMTIDFDLIKNVAIKSVGALSQNTRKVSFITHLKKVVRYKTPSKDPSSVSKRKRKRSGPVLWQKSTYHQKMKVERQYKDAIFTQRLRTNLGRSVGVATVIQLEWLNGFTGSPPFH